MARNNNEWFKFFFRNWLESERVRRMPLAAQGLYLRALCLQAIHGSLPCDLEELAMLLHVRFSEMDAWNDVAKHFTVDTTSPEEPRLYNEHLREVLVLRERDAEARRKGADSANAQRGAQRNAQRTRKTQQPANAQRALRASSSTSSSLSISFSKFWDIYPNRKSKSVALQAWTKLNPDDALVETILGHVTKRAVADPQWVKDGGQFVPMASTFLNQRRWEDEYQTSFTTPPRGIPTFAQENNGAMYADLIPWEDAPVGN